MVASSVKSPSSMGGMQTTTRPNMKMTTKMMSIFVAVALISCTFRETHAHDMLSDNYSHKALPLTLMPRGSIVRTASADGRREDPHCISGIAFI